MIYFTLTAIILYVVSDWILNQIEIKQGKRLKNRSIIFFLIIITLAVISFSIIQEVYKKSGDTGTDDATQVIE